MFVLREQKRGHFRITTEVATTGIAYGIFYFSL